MNSQIEFRTAAYSHTIAGVLSVIPISMDDLITLDPKRLEIGYVSHAPALIYSYTICKNVKVFLYSDHSDE